LHKNKKMAWWDRYRKKTSEEKVESKKELWKKKEKFYIPEPASFPCPDDTHPLFTIKVTKEKLGVCYYCSKVFIVGEDPNED
tara:strand:- start:751 stop:996 length:246 start_codon:yes stop_codon:yes gene_type:complete